MCGNTAGGRSPAVSSLSKAWATILIEDGRNCSPRTTTYSDDYANLYEYCADAHSRKEIAAKFDDAPWVEGALEEFVDKDLMIHLDNRYLSLALPRILTTKVDGDVSAKAQRRKEFAPFFASLRQLRG